MGRECCKKKWKKKLDKFYLIFFVNLKIREFFLIRFLFTLFFLFLIILYNKFKFFLLFLLFLFFFLIVHLQFYKQNIKTIKCRFHIDVFNDALLRLASTATSSSSPFICSISSAHLLSISISQGSRVKVRHRIIPRRIFVSSPYSLILQLKARYCDGTLINTRFILECSFAENEWGGAVGLKNEQNIFPGCILFI